MLIYEDTALQSAKKFILHTLTCIADIDWVSDASFYFLKGKNSGGRLIAIWKYYNWAQRGFRRI